MRNRNNDMGYMPYNEETYDFTEHAAAMRRLKRFRNAVTAVDALYIIFCLALTVASIGVNGFGAFAFLIRALVAAAVIVAGTLFKLNKGVLISSVAGSVLVMMFSVALGMGSVVMLGMDGLVILSAVLFMYLGICERPLSEKPGYPYFNALSYENMQRKEYIPDHKLFESQGRSMENLSVDNIGELAVSEAFQKSGKMDEISFDEMYPNGIMEEK